MVASQIRPTSESQDALVISALSFGYGEPVLKDVSLTVRNGEIVSILGRSGCGKSTLLNLIAGLLTPARGQIEISGSRASSCTSGRAIGYIFQEDTLMPWRTVGANLALAKELRAVSLDSFQQSLMEYLSSFHLDESVLDLYPAQLSGGMRQRVSIIQCLLFNPSLLLLDEPFSALDFYTKLALENEFYSLTKRASKSALFVTHDIEEAIAISDRVILLGNHGTIQADVPIVFNNARRNPEDVRGRPEFAEYYRTIWGQLKVVIGL